MKRINGFQQKKDAIWAKRERESGFHFHFVREFRDAVEKQQGPYLGFDEDNWLSDFDGAVHAAIELAKALLPAPQGIVSLPKGEPQKRYRKPFERRFHLAKFVTECAARSGSTRFNWQRIASEWNKAYTFEMINPEVLRVEYYRAVQDDALVVQLITSKSLETMAEKASDMFLSGDHLPTKHDLLTQFSVPVSVELERYVDVLNLKRRQPFTGEGIEVKDTDFPSSTLEKVEQNLLSQLKTRKMMNEITAYLAHKREGNHERPHRKEGQG